ncbi:hypothetical protein J4G37_30130 [Microvirga sp. 3-52]|nr:hypothetical protein [Microvirga sp. 3-52]
MLKLPRQDGDLIGIPGDNGVRSLSSVLIEALLGLLIVAKGATGDDNGLPFFPEGLFIIDILDPASLGSDPSRCAKCDLFKFRNRTGKVIWPRR